jgi:hypothetical protein
MPAIRQAGGLRYEAGLPWKRRWEEPQIAQIARTQEFVACGFPSTFHPTGEVTVSRKGLPIRVIRGSSHRRFQGEFRFEVKSCS